MSPDAASSSSSTGPTWPRAPRGGSTTATRASSRSSPRSDGWATSTCSPTTRPSSGRLFAGAEARERLVGLHPRRQAAGDHGDGVVLFRLRPQALRRELAVHVHLQAVAVAAQAPVGGVDAP